MFLHDLFKLFQILDMISLHELYQFVMVIGFDISGIPHVTSLDEWHKLIRKVVLCEFSIMTKFSG